MSDKSAKDQESAKSADAGEKKPAVNKQTAKIMQDGVELTWDLHREGELNPQDAADFYIHSVEALKKFKERDPRTEPVLRAAHKQKLETWKAFWNQLKGIGIGVFLALLLMGGFRACGDSSYETPRRYNRH